MLAIDGDAAVVRCEQFDLRVTHPPRGWRPGDLVDVDQRAVIHAFTGTDYPGPTSEIMRLPRNRMQALRLRAKALAAVRAFFSAREFLEVETPLLVPSPGLEIHLDAVRAGDGWLITSPEYQMKRLLAGGFERIFQVCKCFRAGERGAHHSSEFTMIEWYRAHAGLDAIIADTEQLVDAVCGGKARIGDREIDVTPPWPRMTVRDAMQEFAGVRVDGAESAAELAAELRGWGIDVAEGTAWDDAFFAAFLARVEPEITKLDRPLILEDWPAPLAALARRKEGDPKTALRFEAYVGGLELANAFDELTDATEQRARFEDDLQIRRARGKAVYPLDERLLAALGEGLPPSAGIALGFDRLVMLATGATRIDQVLTFATGEL
ncbi:MAG: tRNA synthetase class [Myxococcales bacterium]|nr:tRNA synthetase class [Myxococcales bacterium]